MTRPEEEIARRITSELERSTDQLDPVTRERLFEARKRALEHFHATPQPRFGLPWTGHLLSGLSGLRFSTRGMIALGALLLALSGLAVWQSFGPANEVADIDAGLLTDELPINAYLDKGFDSWLKRGSR